MFFITTKNKSYYNLIKLVITTVLQAFIDYILYATSITDKKNLFSILNYIK